MENLEDGKLAHKRGGKHCRCHRTDGHHHQTNANIGAKNVARPLDFHIGVTGGDGKHSDMFSFVVFEVIGYAHLIVGDVFV